MAKNFNNAYIVKSKDGLGLLYKAAEGTVSDASPSVALPVAFGSVGTISSDGVTISSESDGGETITDSDGVVVKSTSGTTTRTINFTIWETGNPVAMSLVYSNDDIVSSGDSVTGYDESDKTLPVIKLVMEFETDTGKIGRRTFFRAQFQSRGEEVINSQGIAGIPVTYTILQDPSTGLYSSTRVIDRPTGGGED